MMRHLIVWFFVLASSLCTGQEGVTPGADRQPVVAGEVPAPVTERFRREYPGISGNWSAEGDNYRVQFIDPNSRLGHVIVYDRNGDVIRRESELDQQYYPQTIRSFYHSRYPGESYQVWSVTTPDGGTSYYTPRREGTLRFDHYGTPLGEAQVPVKSE